MRLHVVEMLLTALLLGSALPMRAVTLPAVPAMEWHLILTHAPAAWAAGADGHGVRVMVIDSGLDAQMARQALAGSVAPSYAVNPLHTRVPLHPCPALNFIGTPVCMKQVLISNPTPYVDTSGHGSFVACEIACHGLLDGYYGIAPRAQLVVGKIMTTAASGTGMRDIEHAIRWGALHHVAVESLSLEHPFIDPEEADAIAFAQAHGVIVVAAAGNDGEREPCYPSSYPGVLRVAATDRWNRLASFSDRGPDVALAAPGVWVFGLGPSGPTEVACAGLCTLSGTSMATPLVAGALADLLSWGLSPADAVAALEGGAHHWPGMDVQGYGHGVLDLAGALQWAMAHHLPRHGTGQ